MKYLKKKPLKKSNLLKKIKEKADSYDTEKLEADFERIVFIWLYIRSAIEINIDRIQF